MGGVVKRRPPCFNMGLGLFHRVPYFKICGRGFTALPPLFWQEMEESAKRMEGIGEWIPEREKLTPERTLPTLVFPCPAAFVRKTGEDTEKRGKC